jgi:hypothetical protein
VFVFPLRREFRLGDGGVSCTRYGLFVGFVPLLHCTRQSDGTEVWKPRLEVELNRELSNRNGLRKFGVLK